MKKKINRALNKINGYLKRIIEEEKKNMNNFYRCA